MLNWVTTALKKKRKNKSQEQEEKKGNNRATFRGLDREDKLEIMVRESVSVFLSVLKPIG